MYRTDRNHGNIFCGKSFRGKYRTSITSSEPDIRFSERLLQMYVGERCALKPVLSYQPNNSMTSAEAPDSSCTSLRNASSIVSPGRLPPPGSSHRAGLARFTTI